MQPLLDVSYSAGGWVGEREDICSQGLAGDYFERQLVQRTLRTLKDLQQRLRRDDQPGGSFATCLSHRTPPRAPFEPWPRSLAVAVQGLRRRGAAGRLPDNVVVDVRLDRHVRRRVGRARQAVAFRHLLLVQEERAGLLDGAGEHLAGAARARARAAGEGQIQPLLQLCHVQDGLVGRALESARAFRRLKGHLVVRCHAAARRHR
eukprot:CAMPEP_0195078678 /NCGR_PEP_ID=MMETSP0448-20130528/20804_1 /TAXON_ID=66468 /ORGANISM="Heterocapsa triquestra, Strain CCMP 448" /LENGTH=204 /DNA_ID=CAMNT_0040111433 /DNA_START=67 /DNA_END=678 /DNA_ORIENTATION=+